MATKFRIELNHVGVREAALNSREVQALIARKTEAVKAAAQANTSEEVQSSVGGKSRARGIVRVPVWVESRDRVLGTAIDAARGD